MNQVRKLATLEVLYTILVMIPVIACGIIARIGDGFNAVGQWMMRPADRMAYKRWEIKNEAARARRRREAAARDIDRALTPWRDGTKNDPYSM